jgi:hypothetical protein
MYGNAASRPVFDVPVDGWYGWVGASLVAAGLLATAVGLPTAPPPDAGAVADAVDALAASDYAGTATVALDDTDRLRLTTRGVTLAGPDGRSHATFRYGPVTPVRGGGLARVLADGRPARQFATPAALAAAARSARAREPQWSAAPGELRVRRVTWRGVDVTLVG